MVALLAHRENEGKLVKVRVPEGSSAHPSVTSYVAQENGWGGRGEWGMYRKR